MTNFTKIKNAIKRRVNESRVRTVVSSILDDSLPNILAEVDQLDQAFLDAKPVKEGGTPLQNKVYDAVTGMSVNGKDSFESKFAVKPGKLNDFVFKLSDRDATGILKLIKQRKFESIKELDVRKTHGDKRIENPATGNAIKLRTALKAKKGSAVYAKGKAMYNALKDKPTTEGKLTEKYTGNPGDKLTHKHSKAISIELISPTNKGWKVYQIEKGKKKIAHFNKQDITGPKAIFEGKLNEAKNFYQDVVNMRKAYRMLKREQPKKYKELDTKLKIGTMERGLKSLQDYMDRDMAKNERAYASTDGKPYFDYDPGEGKLTEAEDYKYKKYVAKAFDRINDEMFKFRHSMGVKQLTQKDSKLKNKVESMQQAIFNLQKEMKSDGLTEAFKKGDKVKYLGHPATITNVKDYNGKTYYSVSYNKGSGKTKASSILSTDGTITEAKKIKPHGLGYRMNVRRAKADFKKGENIAAVSKQGLGSFKIEDQNDFNKYHPLQWDFAYIVKESKLTEAKIKKGDVIKMDDGEIGVVNKVKGRVAYIKLPSMPGSFHPIEADRTTYKGKHKGKDLYSETKSAPAGHYFTKGGNVVKGKLTEAHPLNKVIGGYPARYEGDPKNYRAIVSGLTNDRAREDMIKRASKAGYIAKPNMGGGVTIFVKEGKLTEAKFYVTYNQGRGMGKKVVTSKESDFEDPRAFRNYNDAEKYVKMAKSGGGSPGRITAYWVSDINMNRIDKAGRRI